MQLSCVHILRVYMSHLTLAQKSSTPALDLCAPDLLLSRSPFSPGQGLSQSCSCHEHDGHFHPFCLLSCLFLTLVTLPLPVCPLKQSVPRR